jgi:hypothetical protein
MTSSAPHLQLRELDARENDGIHVRLMWSPAEDRVLLHVDDTKHGIRLVVPVKRTDALHAFDHPFAYADRAPAFDVDAERVAFEVGR